MADHLRSILNASTMALTFTLAACEGIENVTFGLGERSIRERQVTAKALSHVEPEHKVLSSHVAIGYTGQNSRISEYQVSLKIDQCAAEVVLYYDAAMILRAVDDKHGCIKTK